MPKKPRAVFKRWLEFLALLTSFLAPREGDA
jgi:hypothetical protein